MLHIDYRDPHPIYGQVKEGLKRLMVTGGLAEGEKLPSVRALASSLAINPNTIQRAYEALEQEGFVYSVAGKGSFVAKKEGPDPVRLDQLWKKFDAVVGELLFLGVAGDSIRGRVAVVEEGRAV